MANVEYATGSILVKEFSVLGLPYIWFHLPGMFSAGINANVSCIHLDRNSGEIDPPVISQHIVEGNTSSSVLQKNAVRVTVSLQFLLYYNWNNQII